MGRKGARDSAAWRTKSPPSVARCLPSSPHALHMFVDHVRVFAKAGNGGDGAVRSGGKNSCARRPRWGRWRSWRLDYFSVDENVDNLRSLLFAILKQKTESEAAQAMLCKAAPDQVYHAGRALSIVA